MKQTSLEDIRQIVNGQSFWWPDAGCARPLAPIHAEAVEIDSRQIKHAGLFVAIKGERFDAHDFLLQVFAAGAAGALVDCRRPLPAELTSRFGDRLIGVEDTIVALGRLGRWHRDAMVARVVAVTGSNGKTTTKRMLHHILSRGEGVSPSCLAGILPAWSGEARLTSHSDQDRGTHNAGGTPAPRLRGTCSPKSFNNNIGVPLTLLGVAQGDAYVVCEVGTNAPGEIAQLGDLCQPDVAVITSVGETHLEKLGSLERVAKEKASLLRFVRPGGVAVVWADNESLRREARVAKADGVPLLWFGQSDSADWRLTDIRGGADRVRFSVRGPDVDASDAVTMDLPQPGGHNASNAVAAMAAAACLGVDVRQAAAALADFGGVEMRLEVIQAGGVRLINDAYNANPASMIAAADVLADQPGHRRVMVAGDMRELGESSVSLHERVGRDIAARRVDFLIGIGPLGRHIAHGAAEATTTAASGRPLATTTFDSVESAVTGLPALLQNGDVVLIQGSRSMAMERLIEPIVTAASSQ